MEDAVDPRTLAEEWDDDYKLPRQIVKGDAVIIRGIGAGEVLEVNKTMCLCNPACLGRVLKQAI